MENILLLTVLAATFGFGFLVVKRLDGAMDKREASLRASPYEKRLRVGYSDPRITGSLSESLMRYTRKNPETAVSLFDGTQAELMQALSERKLDLVVLPEGMVMEQQSEVCTKKGMLPCQAFAAEHGVPVEPVSPGTVCVVFVWMAEETGAAVWDFLRCMEKAQ